MNTDVLLDGSSLLHSTNREIVDTTSGTYFHEWLVIMEPKTRYKSTLRVATANRASETQKLRAPE